MSDTKQTIDRILDGYLRNLSQFDETVDLLEAYYDKLSPAERAGFFDILWQRFSAVPISHLTGKRTPHEIVVRSWARFGPADRLAGYLFGALNRNDPSQMESWAIKVGSEFVHSFFSYRGRFSRAALDQIKAQAALITSDKSSELVGVAFPPRLLEFASRLETAVDKTDFERFQREIAPPQDVRAPRTQSGNRGHLRKIAQSRKYGRWKIIRSLSEGGQAHVFLVEDANQEFKGKWVLKRLKNVDSPTRRARFEREIKVVQSISHPNVLRVIDSDLVSPKPYFVSEFCEQGSLLDLGASSFKGNIQTTTTIVSPLIDALIAVHQAGSIHRDLKPGNLLIRADGTPVIGDFGICFVEDGNQVTLADEGIGSKNFIAPEMESGQRDLGEPSDRTDVYGLGKIIYWMLSGGLEFSREDHRKRSLVSLLTDQRFEHIHQLLDAMVVREPQKRVSSYELPRRLQMTASLVEGNYAPLSPSIGIRCRFCGIGQYAPLRNKPGYQIPEIGLSLTAGTDVRVLWCRHCGHVELFQFNGVENRGWWDK